MNSAKEMRKAIGETGFKYSVRFGKDGVHWISANSPTQCTALERRLDALGFLTWLGRPGTCGELIVRAVSVELAEPSEAHP